MTQEAFKTTRTWIESEKQHRAYSSAVCCQCGAVDNVPINTKSPLPPEVIVKKMQTKGWVMGQKRKHDLCPKCVAKKVSEKKVTNIKDYQPPPATQAAPTHMSAALAPISREGKRLIILALEDHYVDASKGYETGWSDDRIARDLNVPRKLVSDIREEFYGPELDMEVAKMRNEILELDGKLATLQAVLSDLRTKQNDLKERMHKKGLM